MTSAGWLGRHVLKGGLLVERYKDIATKLEGVLC
jgi:hypothetical protein